MLTHLYIKNFTIIDSTELEFNPGMTSLTGETGAGKSILLDALGLMLGSRANADSIRQGTEKAIITGSFAIENQPHVIDWLREQDLTDEPECTIRRVLARNGKSRAFINDIPVSLVTLKSLGDRLVAIHGQNAHYTLTQSANQRELLDRYGNSKQLEKVRNAFNSWQKANTKLDKITDQSHSKLQRLDLLNFQLQEFDDLDIGTTTIEEIESEHKWRSSSEKMLSLAHQAIRELDVAAQPALIQAIPLLSDLVQLDQRLQESLDLIESASIQVAEATHMINGAMGRMEHDDNRLQWLDSKLATLHRLAKKHQCQMSELPAVETALRDEFTELSFPEESLDGLKKEVEALKAVYDTESQKLTRHRLKSAKALSSAITSHMHSLNMEGGVFSITVTPGKPQPSATGNDEVKYLISTNPGVKPAPIAKVASGGELSRVSLCFQLATLNSQSIPTLVFDEVDAGIGGAVAETVGKLMRKVAEHTQVLCVTHLAQVASQAHNHWQVSKSVHGKRTITEVNVLDKKATRDEIARMLGGVKITAKTRQHAQEMLDNQTSITDN